VYYYENGERLDESSNELVWVILNPDLPKGSNTPSSAPTVSPASSPIPSPSPSPEPVYEAPIITTREINQKTTEIKGKYNPGATVTLRLLDWNEKIFGTPMTATVNEDGEFFFSDLDLIRVRKIELVTTSKPTDKDVKYIEKKSISNPQLSIKCEEWADQPLTFEAEDGYYILLWLEGHEENQIPKLVENGKIMVYYTDFCDQLPEEGEETKLYYKYEGQESNPYIRLFIERPIPSSNNEPVNEEQNPDRMPNGAPKNENGSPASEEGEEAKTADSDLLPPLTDAPQKVDPRGKILGWIEKDRQGMFYARVLFYRDAFPENPQVELQQKTQDDVDWAVVSDAFVAPTGEKMTVNKKLDIALNGGINPQGLDKELVPEGMEPSEFIRHFVDLDAKESIELVQFSEQDVKREGMFRIVLKDEGKEYVLDERSWEDLGNQQQ
jgi:hypothetical protein